jgi:hypothetical protein
VFVSVAGDGEEEEEGLEDGVKTSRTGAPAPELGVFISASMRTSRIVLPAPSAVPSDSGMSWFAQRVQLKVSPT